MSEQTINQNWQYVCKWGCGHRSVIPSINHDHEGRCPMRPWEPKP